MPETWPHIPLAAFDGATTLPEVAEVMLRPFVDGDPIAAGIGDVVRDAFNFPAPLVPVAHEGRLSVLELFHGPTAAFKDFGARFLAASLSRIRKDASGKPLNILVATSGDTGGAVAAAFHGRPGIVVSVLFPKGLVSPTQERQLTCWGDNVLSYRVAGTFDDCQRLVKEAFVDTALKQRFELSSANSINLGRLLPQAVYYAATSLAVHRAHGVAPNFLIPSRQSRQFRRLRLGAQDRPADRAHRARAQCQSRRSGFPVERAVAAARQHPDAGLRHGCRFA